MRTKTQAHVDAMLATIQGVPSFDDATDETYEAVETAIIDAIDMAEALYVFAHDAGEYNLFSEVMRLPFKPHPRLATGDDRGLTEEGLTIYRELLEMEGLA